MWARWRTRRASEGADNREHGNDAAGSRTAYGSTKGDGESGPAGGQRGPGGLMELAGRRTVKAVEPRIGMSVLELAEKNGVDFASNCRRGTCARCRCRVLEGGQFLSEPNEAEALRLEPEEIASGYRLGCQARVAGIGPMRIRHAPYF